MSKSKYSYVINLSFVDELFNIRNVFFHPFSLSDRSDKFLCLRTFFKYIRVQYLPMVKITLRESFSLRRLTQRRSNTERFRNRQIASHNVHSSLIYLLYYLPSSLVQYLIHSSHYLSWTRNFTHIYRFQKIWVCSELCSII